MKPALLLSVLIGLSLWFGAQATAPVCRGKALPIALLPGPKMTGPSLPLRFGGTREFPRRRAAKNKAAGTVLTRGTQPFTQHL